MGKGRCKPCDYVWAWPGKTAEASSAKCPNCSGSLSRTTKAFVTMCTREQVGLLALDAA